MSVTQWQWQWRLETHTDELVATGTSTNIVYSLCCILYSGIMKAIFFFPHLLAWSKWSVGTTHVITSVEFRVFVHWQHLIHMCIYIGIYACFRTYLILDLYRVQWGAFCVVNILTSHNSDFLSRILSGHWWVGVKIHNLQSWIFNLYAHKNRQWTIILFFPKGSLLLIRMTYRKTEQNLIR